MQVNWRYAIPAFSGVVVGVFAFHIFGGAQHIARAGTAALLLSVLGGYAAFTGRIKGKDNQARIGSFIMGVGLGMASSTLNSFTII